MWTGGVQTHQRNTNKQSCLCMNYSLSSKMMRLGATSGQRFRQDRMLCRTTHHRRHHHICSNSNWFTEKSCSYISWCSSSQICSNLIDKVIFPHSVCRLERNKITVLRWSPWRREVPKVHTVWSNLCSCSNRHFSRNFVKSSWMTSFWTIRQTRGTCSWWLSGSWSSACGQFRPEDQIDPGHSH